MLGLYCLPSKPVWRSVTHRLWRKKKPMRPQAVNKVEYKRAQDIDFTRKRRKSSTCQFWTKTARQRKLPTEPEPTADDLMKLFCNLSNTTARPVILSLVPHFAESYRPQDLSKRFPVVLSDLFNEDCVGLERDVLTEYCDDAFYKITVTEEKARNCEEITREQANWRQWFHSEVGE